MRVVWLALSCLVGLLLSPAQAAIPNTVGWHDLPSTQIDSVCQYPGQGNSGCSAITNAWGDALFDTTRNQMVLLANGGHADYPGNEVIALKIGTTSAITDTQTIERIKNGSASPTSLGGTCQTSDGFPRSMHTYTNLEYISDFDRYLSFGGARWQDGNDVDCVFWLQMPAMTWTVGGTTIIPGRQGAGVYGSGAAWDLERHVVWAFDQFNVYKYTPTAGGGTWSTPTQTSFSGQGVQWDMKGLVDPVRDRYYVIGDGVIWYWNVSNQNNIGARVVPSTSGCGTAFNGGPGSQYYPVQDRIVIWNGGNTITLLNPANHTCTTVSHSGGPSTSTEDTLGRFKYSAKDNLFVTCGLTSQNCKALRLDVQSAETDWGRRKNAPGVWKYQGFDAECVPGLTDGQHYFAGSAGTAGRECDTAIKTSGTSSFRLTIPAGNSSATPSGEWREGLKPGVSVHTGGTGFGQNSTVYWSYRIRITQSMKTNIEQFWRAGTAKTGWKHANAHNMPQGSCGPLEFTGTISTDVSPATQIFYTECGARGVYTNSAGSQGLPYIQQGETFPLTTSTNGWSCNFNNAVSGAGTGQGCMNWQFFDEWLTFKIRLQIGTFGSANSSVRVWIARDGGTQWLSLANSPNYTFNADAPANQREFNVMSFTNFMTGNNQSAPTVAHMWYDEFIVSSNDIDLPGQVSGPPVDTLPPAAPTGVSVSKLEIR